MKNLNFRSALILFCLGIIGILSLLTVKIPIEKLPPEALSKIPTSILPILLLINPTVLLVIAITIGTILHEKVNLKIDAIIELATFKSPIVTIRKSFLTSIIAGISTGIILVLLGVLANKLDAHEFAQLESNFKPTIAARFFYGGLTEEILMRFGLMTFITWLLNKIFNSLTDKIYWTSILLSALIFSLGHLPVVFQSIDSPSMFMIGYIILGNAIGGCVYGLLYWKNGLEAAMIAHILTHVVMVLATTL